MITIGSTRFVQPGSLAATFTRTSGRITRLHGLRCWQWLLTIALLILLGATDWMEYRVHHLGVPDVTEWAIQGALVCGFVILQTVLFSKLDRQLESLHRLTHACAGCHQVRVGDEWLPLEVYLSERTPMRFSHGFCPDCLRRLYPDIADGLRSGRNFNSARPEPLKAGIAT